MILCDTADILNHSQDCMVIIGTWETNIQSQVYSLLTKLELTAQQLLTNYYIEDHILERFNKVNTYCFIGCTDWGVVFESLPSQLIIIN